jgi:hypothetical protein
VSPRAQAKAVSANLAAGGQIEAHFGMRGARGLIPLKLRMARFVH